VIHALDLALRVLSEVEASALKHRMTTDWGSSADQPYR